MREELLYMIDIETTSTDVVEDEILEIGIVEMAMSGMTGCYQPNRELHMVLHSEAQPETLFAKKHMVELYKKCNKQDKKFNYEYARQKVKEWLHMNFTPEEINKPDTPKKFIGWNASGFDLPFMYEKKILDRSRHIEVDGKEKLVGDVHYRVYEMAGVLDALIDSTGLSRKSIQSLANDLAPNNFNMPEGKAHDAIYDCYNQINMMNGFIALQRLGWTIWK